jgi:hypothetical protein
MSRQARGGSAGGLSLFLLPLGEVAASALLRFERREVDGACGLDELTALLDQAFGRSILPKGG